MERKTIKKGNKERVEYHYFISSLKEDIELASRAVRGHWCIESMHWHLDVAFREDANAIIDKTAAQNLNIIRKWCLSILKVTELSKRKLSMKKKRFAISLRPTMLLEIVLNAKKMKHQEDSTSVGIHAIVVGYRKKSLTFLYCYGKVKSVDSVCSTV